MKKQIKTRFYNECQKLKKQISVFKEKHPEISNNDYPTPLLLLFERYIEVYGNAYCMDVKSERRKLARLLHGFLCELKN